MSTDLSEYIDSLKREVTPLGTDPYATVSDDTWIGYLSDAFWEARLDGLMVGYSADEDGLVTKVGDTAAELPRQFVALVVLYAGIKVLRNRILNASATAKLRAKAGPVEFEQESSSLATVMSEMLKQLAATKQRILDEVAEVGVTNVLYLDAFSSRLFDGVSYWGSPELTG